MHVAVGDISARTYQQSKTPAQYIRSLQQNIQQDKFTACMYNNSAQLTDILCSWQHWINSKSKNICHKISKFNAVFVCIHSQ